MVCLPENLPTCPSDRSHGMSGWRLSITVQRLSCSHYTDGPLGTNGTCAQLVLAQLMLASHNADTAASHAMSVSTS